MPTRDIDKLTEAEAERLHWLIQEAGEVVQAATKVLIHGKHSRHPNGGPTNIERLEDEIGNLYAAVGLMFQEADTSPHMINRMIARKIHEPFYLHHNTFSDSTKADSEKFLT